MQLVSVILGNLVTVFDSRIPIDSPREFSLHANQLKPNDFRS